MSFIDNYQRQHDELLDIAGEISKHLSPEGISEHAQEVSRLLTSLTGKLLAHLAMEDKVLYPLLLNQEDEEIQGTAKDFIDEMGGLQQAYKSYIDKWSSADEIKKCADNFIEETGAIFKALSHRIDRENNELYPLTAKV